MPPRLSSHRLARDLARTRLLNPDLTRRVRLQEGSSSQGASSDAGRVQLSGCGSSGSRLQSAAEAVEAEALAILMGAQLHSVWVDIIQPEDLKFGRRLGAGACLGTEPSAWGWKAGSGDGAQGMGMEPRVWGRRPGLGMKSRVWGRRPGFGDGAQG